MTNKNKMRAKIKMAAKQMPLKQDTDYDEVFENINSETPINFKKYNLLDKIYKQYPLTSKEEIALIVKATFEIIREKAIEGYKINIKNIFNEFHLIINKVNNYSFIFPKNRTFPKIRKNVAND